MNNKFFNIFQITYTKLTEEINYYLRTLYNKSGVVLTSASPHGHILNVLKSMYQSLFLQIKIIINSYTLSDNNLTLYKNVRSAAITAGHNPTRFISSTGILRFKYKIGSSVNVANNQIIVKNKTRIKNITNSLEYAVDLGGRDQLIVDLINLNTFYLNIIQGRWEEAIFTSDGSKNQSFQVNPPSNLKGIENFNIEVLVNDEKYEIVFGLYDILTNDHKAAIVRTSFEGGVDIIFGGDGIGYIPPIGSIIKIKYLLSDGSLGNIFRRTVNDFEFIEQPVDGIGNTIDVKNVFDIFINNDINFGSDGESVLFTKAIIPISSSNFVLATPQQYAYHIKKLGVFAHVTAYADKNGWVNILTVPNINLFKNTNQDYFNLNENAFLLDTYETRKIDSYLKAGGNIQLTKRYRIIQPVLSYYVMNIFYVQYTDVEEDNMKTQVLDVLSNYMLNLKRANTIPKKDIMDIIIQLDVFDSFDFNFISKKNEDYHRDQLSGYNPKNILGISPILGDIIFENNEYPILSGGWYDRNFIYYDKDLTYTGLKTINFFKKGTVDRKTIMRTI